MKDLIENSESRGYMTAAEIAENHDHMKVQQALARSANDLVAGIQVPLRREKQAMLDDFNSKIGSVTDETQRKQLTELHEARLKRIELTLWLKDFPKTAADLREMKRSAAQHMPDLDLGIHAALLIEERFKRNYDEEPEVDPNAEVTEEQLKEMTALKLKIQEEEFPNSERLG